MCGNERTVSRGRIVSRSNFVLRFEKECSCTVLHDQKSGQEERERVSERERESRKE